MLQRLIAAALGGLGLLTIGLGVASSTVWRGDDVLAATAAPEAHLVAADPGVLELGGRSVTVTVRAANDTPVVIAVGRDTDVAGWVGTDAHTQITGLASWHGLRTEAVAAPAPTAAPSSDAAPAAPPASQPAASAAADGTGAAAAPIADPSGSDLWVAQATGNGTATLTWEARPGRWSLLVASVGEAPPVVELAWPRTVTTPWLWPGVIVGSLLLLAGLGLAARLWLRARRGQTEPEWHPVLTGAVPVVGSVASNVGDGVPASVGEAAPVALTRRQIREAEAANAANGPVGRRRARGGVESSHTGAQPMVVSGEAREVPVADPSRRDGLSPVAPVNEREWRPAARPGAVPAGHPAPWESSPLTSTSSSTGTSSAPGAMSAPGTGSAPGTRPAVGAPSAPRTPPVPGTPSSERTPAAAVGEPGYRASDRRAGREPLPPTGSPEGPWADESRTQPGPRSSVRVPPAAPQGPAAGPQSSTRALPSYFQRAGASGGARPGAGGPVTPGGWVPGGVPSASPRDGADPDAARRSSTHRAVQRETAAAGGADQPLVPHPTWVSGTPRVAGEPTSAAPVESPSGRADAWRRAWGFPGSEAEPDDAPGADDEGTNR